MGTEENKQVVRRAVEQCWNTGNEALVDELYSDDYLFHTEGGGEQRGRDSVKEWLRVLRGAMSDLRYEIGAIYAEDDRIAFRYTVTGTHDGEFQGIPATNRKLDLTGHMVMHMSDGKIKEVWGYWDTLGLLQQLGLVPPFGGPPAPSEDPTAQHAAAR
jgi:steroid delta-isomerase-like uncharacterized protein